MNYDKQPTSPFEETGRQIQFNNQESDERVEEVLPFGQGDLDNDADSRHSEQYLDLIADQPEDFDFFDQVSNPTDKEADDPEIREPIQVSPEPNPLNSDLPKTDWADPPVPLHQNLVAADLGQGEPGTDEAFKKQIEEEHQLSPIELLIDNPETTEPFPMGEAVDEGDNQFRIQEQVPEPSSDSMPMFSKASNNRGSKATNEVIEPEIEVEVQVSVQPTKRAEGSSPEQQASPVSANNRQQLLDSDDSPQEAMITKTSHLETQLNMFDMKQDSDKKEDPKDEGKEESKEKKESGSPSALAQDDEELDNEDNDASLDSIDKLQNLLNEINETCIEQLKNEEAEAALECLKRAEQILEDYTNEGKDVDRNMIIIVLYNQACCYQRLSMLGECSNYLDGTIYNLQQKLLSFEDQEQELKEMIESVDRQDSSAGPGLNNPYGITQKDSPEERSDVISVQDSLASEEVECSRKLSVSQKIFKLRYLCKCHLQLCAVQSQLNKHKDALHHGKMASIYCQELIRNTFLLSESYIGEILKKRDKGVANAAAAAKAAEEGGYPLDEEDPEKIQRQLGENYYLEDDQKLLDILIKNSHPILKDLTSYIDNFNKYNQLDPVMSKSSMDLAGLNQRFASYFMGLSEYEQELKDLLEKKDQFSIEAEIVSNRQRFRAYEKEVKLPKKVVVPSGLGQPRCASGLGDSEVEAESRRSLSRQGSSKANFQRKFVDEETPARIQQRLALNSEEDEFMMGSFKREANLRQSAAGMPELPKNEPPRMLEDASYFSLRKNVRTLLVTQEEDDWIFNLNIGNVMHLQPLCTEEMNLHVDNSHELSRDAILEKIILLTVSYFCVGTELRFLNNNISPEELFRHTKDSRDEIEGEKKVKKNQSEMWHAQALEASARFLPSECPLVAHVITNYQKHHSPALTAIPEDSELEDDLKVVRPLNEVKNDNINYYQIIRNHIKPEVKVKPPKKEKKLEEKKEPKPSVSEAKKSSGKKKQLGQGGKQSKEQVPAPPEALAPSQEPQQEPQKVPQQVPPQIQAQASAQATPPPQATQNQGPASASELLQEPSLISNPQAQPDSAPPAQQHSQGIDKSALSISCEQFSQITQDHEGIKLRTTVKPKSQVLDSQQAKDALQQQEQSKFSQQESSLPDPDEEEESKGPPSASGLEEGLAFPKGRVTSQKSLKQRTKKKQPTGLLPPGGSKPGLPGTKPLGNYNSASNLKTGMKIKVPSQTKFVPAGQASSRSLKKIKSTKSNLRSSEGTPANEKSKMISTFSDRTLQQAFQTKLSEKQINPIISSSRIKTMPSNKGSKVIKNLSGTTKPRLPTTFKKPNIKTGAGANKKPPLGAMGHPSTTKNLSTEPFDLHQAMAVVPPQVNVLRTVKQSPGRGLGQYGGGPRSQSPIAFGSKKHSVPVISQTTQLPAGSRVKIQKDLAKKPAGAPGAETNTIARNIQMITAALGRKIGNFGVSAFGSEKSTTPKAQQRASDQARTHVPKTKIITTKKRPSEHSLGQQHMHTQPPLAPQQVFDKHHLGKPATRQHEAKDIFSDDDTDANIEGFGDIPSERGINVPTKAFPDSDNGHIMGAHPATAAGRKQVINMPKVSGSSLMMAQKSKIIGTQHKTYGQHHLQSISKQAPGTKRPVPSGMKFGATGQRRVVLDQAKLNNFIQEKMQAGVLSQPRSSYSHGGLHGL